MNDADTTSREDALPERQAALGYVTAAFAEAELDGLDCDFVAQAALFQAFRHLVDTYGEEQTATYAEGLPDRIRSGGFSVAPRH